MNTYYLKSHLRNNILIVSLNWLVFNVKKYIPAETISPKSLVASHWTEWKPADEEPSIKDFTLYPLRSYILILTYDSSGKKYPIIVDGLNGLG